jgi:hypothetical protein
MSCRFVALLAATRAREQLNSAELMGARKSSNLHSYRRAPQTCLGVATMDDEGFTDGSPIAFSTQAGCAPY